MGSDAEQDKDEDAVQPPRAKRRRVNTSAPTTRRTAPIRQARLRCTNSSSLQAQRPPPTQGPKRRQSQRNISEPEPSRGSALEKETLEAAFASFEEWPLEAVLKRVGWMGQRRFRCNPNNYSVGDKLANALTTAFFVRVGTSSALITCSLRIEFPSLQSIAFVTCMEPIELAELRDLCDKNKDLLQTTPLGILALIYAQRVLSWEAWVASLWVNLNEIEVLTFPTGFRTLATTDGCLGVKIESMARQTDEDRESCHTADEAC